MTDRTIWSREDCLNAANDARRLYGKPPIFDPQQEWQEVGGIVDWIRRWYKQKKWGGTVNEIDLEALQNELEDLESRADQLRDRLKHLRYLQDTAEISAVISGDRASAALTMLTMAIPDLSVWSSQVQTARQWSERYRGEELVITWKAGN